jgi:hypothetical protein
MPADAPRPRNRPWATRLRRSGLHFAIADLNNDGMTDIVTSTAYGAFIFFNQISKNRA